jgi:hypothetical protein
MTERSAATVPQRLSLKCTSGRPGWGIASSRSAIAGAEGRRCDGHRGHCLVGALLHLSRKLLNLMLKFFTDDAHFAELRALIVQARATAMNDADPWPAPRPRLDIERDELVMA